jgi:MFS family permease
MQQVMFGMRIIGPAAAAFIVAAFGPRICYFIDAASFAGSACLIASVALAKNDTTKGPAITTEHTGLKRIWLDMQQGIDFILHHAALLFVILALAAGMFVLGCFGPLIAVYVRDSLHASTRIFGVTSAMIGLGMMIGVNAINTFAKKARNTTLVYSGLSGIALGLCLLTAIPHVWATILANLIIGFSVSGIVIPAQTLIQEETPHVLMGRVGSTVMSTIFAAQITGLILSGILANHMGVRHVFAICAALLFILTAAGRLFMEPKEHPALSENSEALQ